jgi:hypothetical protein
VLWNREVWRDAHTVVMLGARKSRAGYWMLRGIDRANERVHVIAEDMFPFGFVTKPVSPVDLFER